MRVQALVVAGPGDMAVETRQAGSPSSGEAVVQVVYGGICGSDLHYWRDGRVGESVLRSPMVLGHEVVGVVAEQAADGSGPPVGARVAVHPARVCGHCAYCLRGEQNLCADLRYLGSAARTPHTDGGFAERLVVPAHRLVPIPEGLDLRTAALAEPASIALHGLRRVRQIGRRVEGADVLVVGAGPIGLLSTALARIAGAATVTATDLFDEPLRLALEVGATHVVRADGDMPATDIAIESSGSAAGTATALTALRHGGTLVSVGHLPPDGVTAPLHLAVTRELTLAGSSRFYHEMPEALSIMNDEPGRFSPIITSVFGLDAASSAFRQVADARGSSKVLLSFAPED
ncbi:L-idonate 5-dehydrogenase [Nonomuraea solani]|uniref:L-idonate 5-dehydrogenase n=1 Tax=Nonomuraea solani TaxID=1144553 RepID=A0A1H6DTH9_9ACTN|nr:alcohol dehydrogenase catalytic domain-containing protein [Nonomuraea solani]SEG87905.1 L-idonate 5-dehydrogenase [Nonomuraea solani]